MSVLTDVRDAMVAAWLSLGAFGSASNQAQADALKEKLAEGVATAVSSNLRDSTRAYARAYSTSGQSIPHNAITVVGWNNTYLDPRGRISGLGTTSWRFTAAEAGIYLVSARVGFTTTGVRGDCWLYLAKNGSVFSLLDFENGLSATSYESLGGSDFVQLAANDYIDIRVNQNQSSAGASRALDTNGQANYVDIIRLVTDL